MAPGTPLWREAGPFELHETILIAPLPKGPYRTKTTMAVAAVVLYYCRSFSLSTGIFFTIFLEKN